MLDMEAEELVVKRTQQKEFFCQPKQEIVCAERWKRMLKNNIETFDS